jgi:hypothetical protein
LLLPPTPIGSSARKGLYTLEDMVEGAGLICIGRVEEIIVVESPEPVTFRTELPIARVAVERWIKGGAGTAFIHHEAWSTWACDDTGAEVGERAMLFLCRAGEIAQSSAPVQDAVKRAVGTAEIYRNWNSGSGILPILEEDGIEYVPKQGIARGVDIDPPLEGAWFLRKLSEQVQYIEGLLRFPRASVSVLARRNCDSAVADSFDLRILENGEIRLETPLGRSEAVRFFELEPRAWQSMKRDLELLVGERDRVIGDPAKKHLARNLVVRIQGSSLTFAEPKDWVPSMDTDLVAFHDALEAWTLVREVAELRLPDPYAEKYGR